MITGIILAAGASTRMGEPKALLKIEGKTFLQHIIDVLRFSQIENIIIVLGAHNEIIKQELSNFNGTVVYNKDWEQGQLSSLRCALNALPVKEHINGVLVCPIDHPLINQAIIVELLMGFWTKHKDIIIPTYNGKRGHPVIFGSEVFDALKAAPLEEGAKSVVHQYSNRIAEIPVNDEGILINIDTPESYATHIQKIVI